MAHYRATAWLHGELRHSIMQPIILSDQSAFELLLDAIHQANMKHGWKDGDCVWQISREGADLA